MILGSWSGLRRRHAGKILLDVEDMENGCECIE